MPADLFFPVPLFVHDVEPQERDAIGRKVSAYLKSERAKRDIAPSPEESVATTYYNAAASILADADLRQLEAIVIDAANRFLEQVLKLPPRRLEVEQSWINIFEPGAQEAQHSHDGNLLSCSYYVEAPENCGCIVFPDPIGARRSFREFTKTFGENLLTRREIAVEPRPGRLVMFESWFPHAIQCNKSDKVRISIAMNLRESAGPPAAASIARQFKPADAASAEAGDAPAPMPQPDKTHSKPFMFNDLFDVQGDLVIHRPLVGPAEVLVIDDVLKHAERARETAGQAPVVNWRDEDGGRNFVDYYNCRLRFPIRYPNTLIAVAQHAIRAAYAVDTRPLEASVDLSWFMQINDKRADFGVPNCDVPGNEQRSFVCILYLNRPAECSGGTAFFRFRKSGSCSFDETYAQSVQEDAQIAESRRDYWPEAPAESWERVGAIEMAQGRLLIFPSEYFHAADHPDNAFLEFPRLALEFRMTQ